MPKIVVSASSMPAGRNMSSQLDYLKKVQTYGADMYHFDVMDGVFVKAETIDYMYLKEMKLNTVLPFDVHLMIANPEKLITKYIKNGADILTLHVEAFKDEKALLKAIERIKKAGVLAGLCIDLDTSVEKVTKYLDVIDLVLIMSVKAGAIGQSFEEKAIAKIKKIRKLNNDILIEVDGGINDSNVKNVIKAGADIVVSGSYIYENDTFMAIQSLKQGNK
ncbi:MAG: ribulose-phosphate 3-epimerase [Clostridia bacterium]|nr:ribulose-phosphate 3-epimerase [Clostridia bacterium]